jgi:prepilin-type N-terminal cleavage/methylation domain-containing protein
MRRRAAAEDGFTIIELLVAMVVGLVVLSAAMVLVSQSTSLTSATQDRIEANDRGRRGLEDVITQVRSMVCAPVSVTSGTGTTVQYRPPVVAGTQTTFEYYTNRGTENAAPQRRLLTYDATSRRIVEDTWAGSWQNDQRGSLPTVTFAASPTRRTLIENVVPLDAVTPIFRYFGWTLDTATPPTVTGTAPMGASLGPADLPRVVKIDIAFRVRPSRATADSKRDAFMQGSATSRFADPNDPAEGVRCT